MTIEVKSIEYESSIPKNTDPKKLFTDFRQSQIHEEAFTAFFAGKTLEPTVTIAEKFGAFYESMSAKQALVVFVRERGGFSFDRNSYPPDIADKIEAYINYVRFQKQRQQEGAGQEELQNIDHERTNLHIVLAEALESAGIAPSRKLGRTLGRLILVDLNLDTYESAAKPDIQRVQKTTSSF